MGEVEFKVINYRTEVLELDQIELMVCQNTSYDTFIGIEQMKWIIY